MAFVPCAQHKEMDCIKLNGKYEYVLTTVPSKLQEALFQEYVLR